MSDLVARIDARIRQIQGLLGEPAVPNKDVGGKKIAYAFPAELDRALLDGHHGSLPPLGKLTGLGRPDVSGLLEPFRPEKLKPMAPGLQGSADPADALSAFLNEGSDGGIGSSNETDLIKRAVEAYQSGRTTQKPPPR